MKHQKISHFYQQGLISKLISLVCIIGLITISSVNGDEIKSTSQSSCSLPSSSSSSTNECNKNYESFANQSNECTCHPHSGQGARIAYFITLHNARTLTDLYTLLPAITAPNNIILIHVDTKFGLLPIRDSYLADYIYADEHDRQYLSSTSTECPVCGSRIIIDSKFDCQWGSWSMNDPTYWAMDLLTNHPSLQNQWDVFINLSSDSFPVYKPQILSNLFDPSAPGPLYNTNFITSNSCVTGFLPTSVNIFPKKWHKRSHYCGDSSDTDCNIKLKTIDENGIPQITTLDIYFGSQWMMLMPDLVKYLSDSLKDENSLPSQLKMYFMHSGKLMSDETFVATLMMNDDVWKSTLPKVTDNGSFEGWKDGLFSVRYERMDENAPDAFRNVYDTQRYDVPKSSDADIPRPWGPYYLGVYDFADIRESGALFIRKVTKSIDHNIFHILPVNHRHEIPFIEWPNEIKVIDKPDWSFMEGKEWP